jgi:superfamily I DNA/RNA helicase
MPGRGHFVVLGTAGSGKTTMAIHRAAYLARQDIAHGGRVLLVTFNKALIAYLRQWQRDDIPGVVFQHYHRFAMGYLQSMGRMGWNWIAKEPARRRLIAQAVDNVRLRSGGEPRALFERRPGWFEEEIRFIQRYGLGAAEYQASERFGRGGPFRREQRPALIAIKDEYERLRIAEGLHYDWEDISGAVVEALGEDERPRMYRHVVIDEGQDFSPQMLRSLAAAVPADGSLTFFGDMAQQIYGRQFSWRQAGLSVQAVVRFRRNYRNTPEIARLGLAVAAMPYFADVPDMVLPDRFEPSGPLPSLVQCGSYREELELTIERAREAALTGTVGVLMRRREDLPAFVRAFRRGQLLNGDMPTYDPRPGISYGTVHAAKGFEFDTVILFGLWGNYWPEPVVERQHGREAVS